MGHTGVVSIESTGQTLDNGTSLATWWRRGGRSGGGRRMMMMVAALETQGLAHRRRRRRSVWKLLIYSSSRYWRRSSAHARVCACVGYLQNRAQRALLRLLHWLCRRGCRSRRTFGLPDLAHDLVEAVFVIYLSVHTNACECACNSHSSLIATDPLGRTLSFALVSMNAQPHRRASCSPSAFDTWRWLSRSHLLPTRTLSHKGAIVRPWERSQSPRKRDQRSECIHWDAVDVLRAQDLVFERRNIVKRAAARDAVHEQEALAFAHPLQSHACMSRSVRERCLLDRQPLEMASGQLLTHLVLHRRVLFLTGRIEDVEQRRVVVDHRLLAVAVLCRWQRRPCRVSALPL